MCVLIVVMHLCKYAGALHLLTFIYGFVARL